MLTPSTHKFTTGYPRTHSAGDLIPSAGPSISINIQRSSQRGTSVHFATDRENFSWAETHGPHLLPEVLTAEIVNRKILDLFARTSDKIEDPSRPPLKLAPEQVIQNYFEALYNLSDRIELELKSPEKYYDLIDFPTNEFFVPTLDHACDDLGGVYIGTAIGGQNETLIAHARPHLAFIVDCNPAIPEIILPALGRMILNSNNRIEFMARLLSVPLETSETEVLSSKTFPDLIKYFIDKGLTLEREASDREEGAPLKAKEIAEMIARHARKEIRPLVEPVLNAFFKESRFSDTTTSYRLINNLFTRINTGIQGWLADDDLFGTVKKMWEEGRIFGVTGYFEGGCLPKINALLQTLGFTVSLIYVSNVFDWFAMKKDHASYRQALSNLASLPKNEKTIILNSGPGGTGVLRIRKYDLFQEGAMDPLKDGMTWAEFYPFSPRNALR